jgi:hypothetical protein
MSPSLRSHTVKVTGVSAELLQRLDRRIQQRHVAGRAAYIRELIQRDIREAGDRTFRQILKPVNSETRRMPDTEAELDAFFEAERERAYGERPSPSPR